MHVCMIHIKHNVIQSTVLFKQRRGHEHSVMEIDALQNIIHCHVEGLAYIRRNKSKYKQREFTEMIVILFSSGGNFGIKPNFLSLN